MGYALVLDTETTSLDKPFCYDMSWVIIDKDGDNLVDAKVFVVEQVWHNLPLFESAYYKEKRPKYVEMMRKHDAVMDKWGYIMQKLNRDIKKWEITEVYAYNSDFDEKVIAFNCEWFKTMNPLDEIPIFDIWGYASEFITNKPEYLAFCETNERFTDTGNYKGSAEVVYQYLKNDPDFIEEHMGVFDSLIEAEILAACVDSGADWATPYKPVKILPRPVLKPFAIKVDGVEVYHGDYLKKYVRNDTYNFKTK